MEKIGIIGAMESEVKELCRQLQYNDCQEYAGLTFNCGILDGKELVVVRSGIGKVNAALCAQILILKFGVTAIINTGIAGALGQGLKIFDFVVSSAALYHDFDTVAFGYKKGQVPGMVEEFPADPELADLAVKAFSYTDFSHKYKIVKGLVASGDQFVSDQQQKKAIQESFNPACVEMEGCAVAHTCYVNKIPFVIVRCMSDMADESVEETYSFNEDSCAAASASLVKKMIELKK